MPLVLNVFSRDKKAREGLEEVNKKFEELHHKFKLLSMEWEEAYEKINHSLRKLGRRAEMLQKEMDGGRKPLSPEEQALAANMSDSTEEGDGSLSPPGGFMTPRQRALQQAVLQRRRHQ